MIKKLLELEAIITAKLSPIIAKIKTALSPVMKIGIVLTAFYSVYMGTWILGHFIFKWNVAWMFSRIEALYIAAALFFISMIMLIVTGGIVEAFHLLLKAATAALEFIGLTEPDEYDRAYDSMIMIMIRVTFNFLILFIAVAVAAYFAFGVPIIPILVHKFRKTEE